VAFEKRFAIHLAAHTLAYGLSDSPAGMLAWIAEGWVNWSDHGGDVETVLSKNDLCTHATIYRVTNTIGPRSALRQQPPLPLDPAPRLPAAHRGATGITFVGYENISGVSTRPARPALPQRPHPAQPSSRHPDGYSASTWNGCRRIWPAYVACVVGPDGSRRLQKDRLEDHRDDQGTSDT